MLPDNSAEIIAKEWWRGREIIYEGVELGECMAYDVLQIVNRFEINSLKPDEAKIDPTPS